MTMENKKATCGVGSTTGSKSNQAMASVAQQGGEVKQRIMLLYPCDVCRKRCTSSSYSRCPAFKSWVRTSWYWITRYIKKSAAKEATSTAAQTRTSRSRLAVIR